MVKDLSYCLDRAAENGTKLRLTKDVYKEYQKLLKQGYSDLDTSALILAKDSDN